MPTPCECAPESAALLEQDAAYGTLGTDEERALMDTYYDIVFARADVSLGSQSTKQRAKHPETLWMSQEDLASLSEDARNAVADAWLADHDPEGHVANLREMQRLYSETHPEYDAYRTWRRDTEKQWGTAGAFRQAAVRANPNYAQYIEGVTRKDRSQGMPFSDIQADLDKETFSLDAYFAYTGQRKSRFDPMPLPTGAPLPVASEGATGETAFGGSGYGESRTWEQRVRDAIKETHDALLASYDYLGVPLDRLPAEVASAYVNSADYPEAAKMPADAWIFEDYKQFYDEQKAAGGDPSIEAFIAATSKDPNAAPDRYQSGVWPPVAIGG